MSLDYVTIRSLEIKGKNSEDIPVHAMKEYGAK
jgi:hypothetical protein